MLRMFREKVNQTKQYLKKILYTVFEISHFPTSAKWLLVYNFITTFGSIFSPFLLPYLTDWGHLTIEQIFTLQSVFLFVSLIAEIPTGVVADKYSPKLSVILGDVFFMFGILLYAITPNFYMFILGEVFMGIGHAFISGAYDALEYETLKSFKKTKLYDEFISIRRQISLSAFILTSLFGMLIIYLGGLRYIAIISAIFVFLGLIPITFKVQDVKAINTSKDENESFSPNYLQIIKNALKNLRNSPTLKLLVILGILFELLNSWLWWMSQSLWKFIGLSTLFFGVAPIFRKFTGILFNRYWPKLIKKYTRIGLFFRLIGASILLLVTSFITLKIPHYCPYINAIILSITAAIMVEFVTIIQKPKQNLINSKNRSTLISFESLVFSIIFVILNPLVGRFTENAPILALYSITSTFLTTIVFLFIFAKNLRQALS